MSDKHSKFLNQAHPFEFGQYYSDLATDGLDQGAKHRFLYKADENEY